MEDSGPLAIGHFPSSILYPRAHFEDEDENEDEDDSYVGDATE
jgi:hypothetical protein